MSNSKSFVGHVVVVDIELVDVQWHRIEDVYQFEVDVEKYICRLSRIQRPSCSRCRLVCLLILHSFLFLLLSSPSTCPFREFCPLQGSLCDEFVLSFASPHLRRGCELNLQHSHCLQESLVHAIVLDLGCPKNLRDLSSKGVVGADQ